MLHVQIVRCGDFCVLFWLLHEDIILCRARAGSLLGVCANIVCLLSMMLQPYMPEVSHQIQEQIQVKKMLSVLELDQTEYPPHAAEGKVYLVGVV